MTFLVYLTWRRATYCYLIPQNTFRSANIIKSCLLTKPSTVPLWRPLWLAKAHTKLLKLLACCLWHWATAAVVNQESRQKGWGLKSQCGGEQVSGTAGRNSPKSPEASKEQTLTKVHITLFNAWARWSSSFFCFSFSCISSSSWNASCCWMVTGV